MNNAQKILFGGGFPRTVASASDGDLRQFFVHSEDEFSMFFDHNKHEKNLYSSICKFRSDMRPVLANVPFDFDSPMKDSVFDNSLTDLQKIESMRTDESLAEEVLGEVWKDTQSLVRKCKEESIPVVSVFSGLGIHCHLLYKHRVNPIKEKVSISNYFIEKCNLNTWDRQIVTDARRILRIPNSKRIDGPSVHTSFCIPITENEVLENNIHDLLERCKEPKDIPFHQRYKIENRPEMEVKEDYTEANEETVGTVQLHKRSVDDSVPELYEWIVRNSIPLPCVRERFLQSNPNHMIRFNGVVFLYQAGYSIEDVRDIIRNIGWIDYDESITKKMTKQIWNRKYSESTCSKIKSLGLCVYGPEFDDFSDDPTDCDTYKWTSGEAKY